MNLISTSFLKKFTRLIIFIILIFQTNLSIAGENITRGWTAEDFASQCADRNNEYSYGLCVGIISAYAYWLVDTAQTTYGLGGRNTAQDYDNYLLQTKKLSKPELEKFKALTTKASPSPMESFFGCPENKSPTQLIATYLKWVNEHPEKWHIGYRLAITEAFSTAFPNCDS